MERMVRESGHRGAAIRELADVYVGSERTIIAWCLGVTQHEHGVDTIREIVNVLLLRGNIGRPGLGRPRFAGTATFRATAPAGSTTAPDQRLAGPAGAGLRDQAAPPARAMGRSQTIRGDASR